MTTFISPGVYTVEQDLSAYVSNLSATIVGMVGTADSGPTNTPVLITTQNDFVTTFGNLNPQHYLSYAAMSYLEQGNQLWVTRVSASDAAFANSAMFLPSGYKQFSGNWTLAEQTSSSITLSLSDSATAIGVNKTIVLGSSTSLPGFDPTDTTNATVSTGKLGSDFLSLAQASHSPALGVPFNIVTGAGTNTSATIVGVGTTGASPNFIPQVTLPLSAFSVTNSPATALAAGSIALATPSSFTAPSADTVLMTIGLTSLDVPINIVYSTANADAALAKVVAGTFGNSPTDLEAFLSVTGASPVAAYNIELPLYNPSIAGNNAKSLALLNAILTQLLVVLNTASAPTNTYTNSLAFYAHCRVVLPSSTLYGVGSITVGGLSQGFSAVTTKLDAANNILQLNLVSLTSGIYGLFSYALQTVPPAAPLVTSDQTISGTFTTNMYRPSWTMVASGASYVPAILKFTSLGETDASNLAIVLNMTAGDVTSSDEQNYTINIYQRNSTFSISSSSVKLGDFSLSESYYGTIENIQSTMSTSSRTVSLKIDYTTVDTLTIATGAVVNHGDNLAYSPVLLTSDSTGGVSVGTKYLPIANSSGYNKSLTTFLLGGSLGTTITAYDIAGSAALGTGLYSFSNAEAIDINLLLAPGWSADPIVSTAMVTICESRGDAMAIIDTPFGLNVQSVKAYRNNIANINSSYAAMYYPWVQIADTVNKKNVFVPPSGQVVTQYAYNDAVADVYYAPAGITRGMLTDALSTERLLSQGDRDVLASANINPIHNEPGYGIYIRGQYTLQTATTALNRVNVRRLLLSLRKVIATASRVFEFMPGDMTTAYQLQQVADGLLKAQLKLGSIQSYKIDVGPNVNTAAVINNNQLAMQISIIPTKTAEVIIETFTILPQVGVTSTTTTTTA